MKKLFILLSLACMGLAVSSCYDDSELWESVNGLESRVKTLETLCSEMNTNISSLQDLAAAVQKGGYITEVTPLTENGVEVGYKVTLNDGRMVTIYHGKNGSAGNAPQIGVKQDSDGEYYWVLGGEWIKDDKGNKVPVSSGTTPKIKVENGKWYVSYDGGTTWEELGAATASDTCLFDDVTYTNGVLTLKFAGGNVLSFPIGDTFRIVLGDYDPNWGDEVEIPYTIQGATGEVMMFAMTDLLNSYHDVWVTEIVEESAYSGKIKVRISYWDEEEYTVKLAIFAVDEKGRTISKIIKLATGVMSLTGDTDYFVGYEESQLSVSLTTNRSYEVSTNADWITFAETKAVEEKTLTFNVQENTGYYRNAEIYITSNNKKITIPICQKAGDGSVFYVTKKAHVYKNRYFDVYLDGDDDNILVNPKGEKLHEVLGYDTWGDLARAIGPWETVDALAGDIIIRAYNPRDGKPYRDTDYYYGNVPSFRFGAEGEISPYNYYVEFSWHFTYNEEGDDLLNPYFGCSINNLNIIAGDSYTFGVLLSSDDVEARIEVTIEIEDFVDPEVGLYDDPAEPGKYEFNIYDEVNLTELESSVSNRITNDDVWEIIKQTLGMTSYELYRGQEDCDTYIMDIKDNKYSNPTTFRMDADGNILESYIDPKEIIKINWALFEPSSSKFSNRINMSIPTDGFDNNTYTYNFSEAVIDACENEVVLSYQYVFEYSDPEDYVYQEYPDYELIFNHEIKFVKGDSQVQ